MSYNTDLMKYIAHYSSKGYELIDVPFIVDIDVSGLTKPDFANDIHHNNNKVYVASGEQSFLQLIKEDKLQCNKYMCLTPCLRDEKNKDDLHYHMFMKLELIHVLKYTDNTFNALQSMYQSAIEVNCKNLPNVTWDELINPLGEYDIYSNNIEVGSYGVREAFNIRYVYGTGIALPRHNIAKNTL